MTNHASTHVLARLEIGFRTDSAKLKALEEDLAATLQAARRLGKKHGLSDDWGTNWHQQWDKIEEILSRIRGLVNQMDRSIEGSDSDRFTKALEAWDAIQAEDAKLVEALSTIRAQAIELNAVVREDWEILDRTLDSHLEPIHACAQALRIKLELLKKHSKDDVDQAIQGVLSKLPNRSLAEGMDAEGCEKEYRKAARQLEKERHRFLGFVDVVKGLSLWVETPGERLEKNLTHAEDRESPLTGPPPTQTGTTPPAQRRQP